MKTLYRKIHSRFKLNGIPYSMDDLPEVAYSLIKEGEAFEKALGDFLLQWMDDHPDLEVQTSGSTGKPKPITLQKRHMVNSALATGEFFGLLPGDSALLCLPVDYIAGKMMLVRAMVLGLELDYIAPSSNPLEGVLKSYDFCAMVPLQLENSLDSLGWIKILIVGGAPLSPKVQEQVRAHDHGRRRRRQSEKKRSTEYKLQPSNFATAVFETYGMTETITHIALKKVNAGSGRGEAKPQKTFKTLPEVTVSLDDRCCLVIDAPKIIDVPVVTNDVVDLVSETEFEWLGRYDNVINSGGVKLFPEQIEAKLAAVLQSRFFVAGIPDKKWGRKLILIVEGEIEEKRLFQEIRSLKSLSKFEIPKEIYGISEFYRTESGKIQRGKILARILG